jgi:hypothetical protein
MSGKWGKYWRATLVIGIGKHYFPSLFSFHFSRAWLSSFPLLLLPVKAAYAHIVFVGFLADLPLKATSGAFVKPRRHTVPKMRPGWVTEVGSHSRSQEVLDCKTTRAAHQGNQQ